MTCKEFLESIEDLALGSVGPTRSGSLRDHASSCPACAARLSETEGLNARLQGIRISHVPPPGLRERILDAIAHTGDGLSAAPPVTRLVRLWRWAPAAAALLLFAAFAALFVAGPGPAVPSVVADTLAAYDGLAARGASLDVRSSSPEAVRAFFRDVPGLSVPEPKCCGACSCPPGHCPCTLQGGRVCDMPSAGRRVPCVMYDHSGMPLAMLHVGANRLDAGALATAERVESRGHTVYCFRRNGVTVAFCPTCGPSTLWVSRLETGKLLEASHAMMGGKPAE